MLGKRKFVAYKKHPQDGIGDLRICVSRLCRSTLNLLRRTTIGLGTFIVWMFSLVSYLNVVPTIARLLKPHRHLRKRTYEATDGVTYVPGFRDRLIQLVSTESTNRKRLLRWVNAQASCLHHVTDLSSQWCDGTVMCALVNAMVAGTCPRHDLLRKEHAVNNCRLALRLVQKNLGIREPMTPEEMADPERINEKKLMRYIECIKIASSIPIEEPKAQIKLPDNCSPIEIGIEKECSASGSGLVVAVIDKRARFTITTQDYKYKNLYVEITGPNREKVRRKIVTTKIQRGCLLNGTSSQSSKDEPHPEEDGPPEPIPLDYQIIKQGSYQVNYIPRSLGIYQVAITWGGEHIKNSPFKVRSTTAKNIEQTAVKTTPGVAKMVSFQDEHDQGIDNEASESLTQSDAEGSSVRSRRQSLVRQAHISMLRDSLESNSTSPFSSMCSSMVSSIDHSIDAASDVFLPNLHGHPHGTHPHLSRHSSSLSTASSRSGSILSRSSSIMHSTDRPPAVKTRRKVIRRIIKGAGGTEEVTYPNVRNSSVLSSSQMSSMASTPSMSASMSIDERFPKCSTSSSSSSASASLPRPRGPNTPTLAEKYATHFSKILITEALNELSNQTPAVSLTLVQQAKGSPLKDQLSKTPPTGQNQGNARESKPPQTHSDTSGGLPPSGASSCNNEERQKVAGEQIDQTKNSAHLDEYLKYRKEFLLSIKKEDKSSTSEVPTASIKDDKVVEKPWKSHVSNTTSKSTETTGYTRRTHKRRKEDKATQCTAQDIKTATGWISRRNVYRNVQESNRQKDSNGDSAIGESEGSVVNSSSDRDNKQAKKTRTGSRGSVQGPVPEAIARQSIQDQGSRTVTSTFQQHRRGRSGTQSSSQGRQSTFDSGFSDENGHNVAQESKRIADERNRRASAKTDQKMAKPNTSSEQETQDPLTLPNDNKELTTETNVQNFVVSTQDQQIGLINIHLASLDQASEDCTGLGSTKYNVESQNITQTLSENEMGKDLVTVQYLAVETPCPGSSTAPTPGDSTVGNISSPEDDIASEDCKSNTSSDFPDSGVPVHNPPDDRFKKKPPYDHEKLTKDASLDALLQTLENDPDYSTREFLRKYRPMMEDDLGILDQLQTAEPDVNGHTRGEFGSSSFHGNRGVPREDDVVALSLPMPERCHASGVGLYNGNVGAKNNFQIRTSSAGDGSLSVTIRGPRPHTVNETNVVYTGDDLYEVIYDVTLAGFYVISVKWGDKHIPDSPFIVKVTF